MKKLALLLILGLFLLSSCKIQNEVVNIENKEYCNSMQRNVEFCYTLYEPVCGYSETEQIETYSNICNACKNPEVAFFTRGECK